MAGVVVLIVVAAFELLAFLGFRLALRADAHRRRARVVAALYWLVSAAALGALMGFACLGPRNIDDEPQIPRAVIVAAVAVYLPKIALAFLTALDLARRALAWIVWRWFARTEAVRPGWLTRTRLLPRLGLAVAGFAFAAVIWGATFTRSDVRVYRHTVFSESLPAEFDGLRVAHLSDIHASSLGAGAALAWSPPSTPSALTWWSTPEITASRRTSRAAPRSSADCARD